jgi:hypothetical protein
MISEGGVYLAINWLIRNNGKWIELLEVRARRTLNTQMKPRGRVQDLGEKGCFRLIQESIRILTRLKFSQLLNRIKDKFIDHSRAG